MNGAQPNGASFGAVISLDGRHVVFNSTASNLVPRDTNGLPDVFVRDLATGVIERVSVGPYGRQGNADSGGISNPAVSGDGRLAVFTSDASNLVSGDTNNLPDVFLRDRVAKTTRRVSVGPAGIQGNGMSGSFPPAISADGRVVVFESLASTLVASDTNGVADVFVRDLQAGATRRVSVGPGGRQADNGSESVSVSADGRIVTFASYAANLVAGDTNGVRDVFARDRSAGVTLRISVSSAGLQADASSLTPAVSADGRHVAFSSDASNLAGGDTNTATDVFVRDCV